MQTLTLGHPCIHETSFWHEPQRVHFRVLFSQITKDGCGEIKRCYSEPADCEGSSDCNYFVTIKPVKGGDGQGDVTEVEFEISSNKQWASIGFNKEKKMVRTILR